MVSSIGVYTLNSVSAKRGEVQTFWLQELHTVRLICQKDGCNAVVELTISQLAKDQPSHCPVCGKTLVFSDHPSSATLQQLAVAIEKAREPGLAKLVKVEFVMPEKPATPN